MAVNGIESKGNILVYTITLWAVFIVPTDHRTLDSIAFHNGNTTLIAGGIAAVGIQCAGSFCFIDTAVGIVRLHGIGVLGANAESRWFEQRLVIVAGERCRLIRLYERTLATAFAA